jgi:hypothetical protein
VDESGCGENLPAAASVICASCCVATQVRISLSTFSMFFSVATSNTGSVAARLDDLLAEGDGRESERVRICYHIGIR